MKRYLLFIFFSALFGIPASGQTLMCADSEPFCTGSIYTFPAGTSGSAEPGPNYGCLQTQPAPAWYHMLIDDPGMIQIYMYSTPLVDIDFICWGPFTDPVAPCPMGLTASKIVDCSYSPAPQETCVIPNGQTGEYYILLITNYSQQQCNITFSQTGGNGSTDCTILPPLVTNNGPLCTGQTLQLNAEAISSATYEWSGPDNFSSTLEDPIILNVGMENAGDYSCIITVNGQSSDPAVTTVVIHQTPVPEYEFTEECYTNPTQFTDLSTIEPPAEITSWKWNFDDNGATSIEQNPSYTFSAAGVYDVMLTVTNDGHCPQNKTHQVEVFEMAEIYAGDDQQIPFGWSTQLEGEASGGSGSYDYHWEPADLLVDPNLINPNTVSLEATTVFTLTVTDNASGCESIDEMVVNVTGGAMAVIVSADPEVICNGERTELNALASGGGGDYTYNWSSDPPGFSAEIAEPFDYPEETTTYFVEVGDGANSVSGSVTVTVKPKPAADAGDDMSINAGTSTQIIGDASGGTGNYTYQWEPADSLIDPTALSPTTEILYTTTEFSLVVYDENGCESDTDNMVLSVGGDLLSIAPNASPSVICYGESTVLTAYASGGSGSYDYEWIENGNTISTSATVTVSPATTTTYGLNVFDGFKNVSGEVTVQVDPLPEINLIPDNVHIHGEDTVLACIYDSVVLDAGNPGAQYEWSNGSTDRKVYAGTIGIGYDMKTFSVDVINPVTGCKNAATITIIFTPTECTGIEETKMERDIRLEPNPSKGQVNIFFNKEIPDALYFELFSMQGEMVLKQEIVKQSENRSEIIDLNNMQKGVYLVKIYSGDLLYTDKLILQ